MRDVVWILIGSLSLGCGLVLDLPPPQLHEFGAEEDASVSPNGDTGTIVPNDAGDSSDIGIIRDAAQDTGADEDAGRLNDVGFDGNAIVDA